MGEKLVALFADKLKDAVVIGCARGGLVGAREVVKKIRENKDYSPRLDTEG